MQLNSYPQYAAILTDLHAAWQSVQDTHTMRLVLIEGESGMKKSRLVRTFIEESQAPCITGRCSDIPEPYLPFRLTYESLLELKVVQEQLRKPPQGVTDDRWKIALTTFAQALRMVQSTGNPVWKQLQQWQSTALVSSDASDLDAERAGHPKPISFPEVLTFSLGDLTGIVPAVLFIQNLNLADAATLEALIRTVLPALKENPLLVIVDFETPQEEQRRTFEEFFEVTHHFPDTLRFKLELLSEQEIQELARTEFETLYQHIPAGQRNAFFQQIRSYTQGNFARSLDLLYWIEQANEQDIFTTFEAFPDFGSILQARFERLTEPEQRFLQMAAIHGYHCCLPVVTCALGMTQDEVELILKHVLRETGGWIRFNIPANIGEQTADWYEFLGQPRYQLVLHSIPQEQYSEFSQDIAYAIEQVYAENVGAMAGLLASKFEQGGLRAKAAEYYSIVAEQANEQGDFERGTEYAQLGLDNLKHLQSISESEKLQCALLIEKGQAMQFTRQAFSAEEVLREAYQSASELQNMVLKAKAARYLVPILLEQNNREEGISIAKQSIELALSLRNLAVMTQEMESLREIYRRQGTAEQEHFFNYCDTLMLKIGEDVTPLNQVAKAEILGVKGWLRYKRDEYEAAIATFQKAFQYLGKLESPELYPEIHYKLYSYSAIVSRFIGNYQQALQESAQAIRWADASCRRKNQVRARYEKAKTLQWMGKVDEGEQIVQAALQLLKYSSDLDTVSELENDYGFFLSKIGRKRKAKELYLQSYEHKRAANRFENLQVSINNIAVIDKVLGLFQQSLAAHQRLLSEAINQRNKSRESLSLNQIGEIYRLQSRMREAEQLHLQAIQVCEDFHNIGRKAESLRYLGQAYLANWDIERAADVILGSANLYQKKLGVSDHINHDIQIFVGRLTLCQGNIAESIQILKETITGLEKIRHLLWVGIGYLNLGIAYLVGRNNCEALKSAKSAFELLQSTESWRISEAHHLLARCYLALENPDQARKEIEKAKSLFMKFKLFHRVHQAENTEIKIEEARETGDFEQYRALDVEELRQDFNHLGI